MASQKRFGEPYQLAGKRMAFTNYQFIRPGNFGWFDEQGKSVTVVGDQGPWDAHIRLSERPFGIRIRALPAERAAAPFQLQPEKPWEEEGVRVRQLLYDDEAGLYKAWGGCSARGQGYACYLQSKDFETWERPELGVVEFDGSKKNNLIDTGGSLGNIFKDPSSREERWKWISESPITRAEYDAYRQKYPRDWDPKADRVDVTQETHVGPGNLIAGVKGGVSPDGFRWTPLPEPLVVEHSDTRVTAYYDVRLQKYVGYFREWMVGERHPDAPDDRGLSWMVGRRSIGRAETEDFRHFPLSEIILEPGPDIVGIPSDLLYSNGHTFVPHGPDQHLFFPFIWHGTSDAGSIAVLSSSDGKNLHWLPGNPVLETAPFMEWDGGFVHDAGGLLELPNGDWVFPYGASNFPHKYPRKGPIKAGIGLATWKQGRMIAVEAREWGQFTSYALIPPGRTLHVNALTLRGGSLRVEVTDLKRQVVPGRSFDDCKPIIGDQHRAAVTWNGSADLGVPDGTPVCLRFRLDQGQLFFVDFD